MNYEIPLHKHTHTSTQHSKEQDQCSAGVCVSCWARLWWPVFTMWWSWVMVSQTLPSPVQRLRMALPCAELLFWLHYLWSVVFIFCLQVSVRADSSRDCILLTLIKTQSSCASVPACHVWWVVTTEAEGDTITYSTWPWTSDTVERCLRQSQWAPPAF